MGHWELRQTVVFSLENNLTLDLLKNSRYGASSTQKESRTKSESCVFGAPRAFQALRNIFCSVFF
jgi:hypothetical protein